jgi:quinol monooxygenase YgiN
VSVTVVLEVQAQSGKADEVKAAFKAILPDTRKYDGCEGVTVHQSQDEPDTIVLLETWATRPQYEKYLAWRTERNDLAALAQLLAAPPSIRFFEGVDA